MRGWVRLRQIGCFGTTDPGAAKDGRSGPGGAEPRRPEGQRSDIPARPAADHASKQATAMPVPEHALTRVGARQARMPNGRKV